MIKKPLVILVLLALLTQLVPGGLFQTTGVEAQEPDSASKISSLLALQVDAKLRAVKAGGLPAASEASNQTGLFDVLQSPGMRLEDLSKQQIFIHFTQEPTQSQIAELEADNVTLHLDSWIPPLENHPSGFMLADMPIDKLETLAEKGYVVRLETAERLLEPQNDLGTQKINVPAVWAAGYNGTGVRIAVLDSGLDLTHADIPTPVAKKDYSNYPVLDDTIANTVSGHGTHVTGSVLGRGTRSGGVYKGSAPGADLVFLKIGNDTNAGASTPAIVNAIKAATDNYSADIITMSYGGWDAYHDGTSEESQAVDYAVSRGAVVLIAAGNSATSAWHYSGTVAAGSTTGFIQINVTGAGSGDTTLWFNSVWYDGLGTHNNLSLQFYGPSQAVISTVNEAQTESSRGTEARMGYIGPSSGNHYAVLPGTNPHYVTVTNNSASTQLFHLYVYVSGNKVTFQNADPNYTISSPADADSAIAVGAYTTRKVWYDYANNGWQSTAETVDQISTFSNRGPRVDTGAPPKPNIVAPGTKIISARDSVVYPWANRGAYYIDNDGPNRSNAAGGSNDGNGPADYYLMQGTSMATPLAAGVAALILQKNPSWTPAQVKQALESTADDKGAAGWDSTYGWGLINAQAAISEPPAVITNAADNITASSARLSGNLTSRGTAATANVSFTWGTSSGNYTFETTPVSMNATGNFSAGISSLSANTTYYFKAKASSDNITVSGSELSFTTKALVSIEIAPDNPGLLTGRTQQFTATGTYSDNTTANITATANWTSSNTSVATINTTGLAMALVAGNTTITAALGGVSDNSTLTVTTSVEVNSGERLTLAANESRGNIPLTIKGIPNSGNGTGVGGFIFNLSWNKDVIRVDNVTAASIGGFSLVAGAPNNTTGTANITGNTSGSYLVGNITVATLGISAVGAAGNSTSINVTITQLINHNLNPISATAVNATVEIINLVAETSISQGLSSNVTVVKVNIDRIKNPSDNATANITGGIGSYSATVSGNASSNIQFLAVNGVPPFNGPSFNATTGVFSVAVVASPIQANNTTVAEVVPILTGNTTANVTLTVTFQAIGAAGQPGLNVPEEHSNTIILLRGDADKSGAISIVDSLAIKQYLVGQLILAQINPLNAASPKHDGAGGDKISIVDALAIEQFLVGQINAYFE